MSDNLTQGTDQKDPEAVPAENSLPMLNSNAAPPTPENTNTLPLTNTEDLLQSKGTLSGNTLPPLPDPSTLSGAKPSLPPLPISEGNQPVHMSVPTTDLPQRKDGSIMMTLLIFFMLLISGLGIYLYVAYTNLASQDLPTEINPVSYSR